MKNVSKILLIILIICLLLTFVACPNVNAPDSGEQSGSDNGGGNQEDNQDEVTSMKITIGNKEFTAKLYDTEAAKAFAKLLPLTLNMSELNGNEKYCNMTQTFPTQSERVGHINAGDIMLYGNNCIVLFYESFDTIFSYTKIGKLDDVTGLAEAVGSGRISVTFSL